MLPVPDPLIAIEPVADPHEEGLVAEATVIDGKVFTLIVTVALLEHPEVVPVTVYTVVINGVTV
jgi:hypothetical protein